MNYSDYLQSIGEFGIVREINHPIAVITGLPTARSHEIVVFESGEWGQVYAIDEDTIEILVFSKNPIQIGTHLARTNKFLSVPVGQSLIGRIIDPLGNAIINATNYTKPTEERNINSEPPGISKRARVKVPFTTGVSVIDLTIPLGRGQKELVIGDRKTGKTSFLLSCVKKHVSDGGIAIYAAIARKQSDIKKLQNYFEKEGLMDKIIIVATSAHDSPSLIHLTPYSAMSIAEYFRDQGMNSLLILDDLSSHAKFYREIALLGKRFPGRDSYPGDIFYTHARLLERAGNFVHPTRGEVSITCLPVVEIIEGDLTGYIATNIMGITDGHIFFDTNVYNKGRRPAIDVSLSVTRVGRQTQSLLKREINRELTAFISLYERMENFSHFGAELSEKIKSILRTGQKIYYFFNQHFSVIIPEELQLIVFGLIWTKALDEFPDETINQIQNKLIELYPDQRNQAYFKQIANAENFYGFLTNINKNRDKLFELCQVKSQSSRK